MAYRGTICSKYNRIKMASFLTNYKCIPIQHLTEIQHRILSVIFGAKALKVSGTCYRNDVFLQGAVVESSEPGGERSGGCQESTLRGINVLQSSYGYNINQI